MKTKLLIALLFISFSLYAQISTHEKPIGLQSGVSAIKKNVKTTKSISTINNSIVACTYTGTEY